MPVAAAYLYLYYPQCLVFRRQNTKNSEVGKQAHISRSNLAIVFRGREVSSLYIRVTQIRESAASRSTNYRQLKGYGTQETHHKQPHTTTAYRQCPKLSTS